MTELIETSQRLTKRTKEGFKRYLYSTISWKDRLIEINGSRGVGKTTLMLQKVKELNREHKGSSLYITLDDPHFFSHSLSSVAEDFQKFGGKFLFLDEVHKYPSTYHGYDWSAEIKSLYDRYPDLHIIYSGSSSLKLYKGQGDLSRRRSTYNLKGLSLREFIQYEIGQQFSTVTIQEIIKSHADFANDVTSKIKIFPYFKDYLNFGYYPFYKESPEKYPERLKEVINVILETDIPSVSEISFPTILKIKRLLGAIGSSVPFTPNLSDLRSRLYIADQRTLLKYLNYLEKSEIINMLRQRASGTQLFNKPDKIYLHNTNLFTALDLPVQEVGTIRETFFMNQVSFGGQLQFPGSMDFILNDHLLFEIGGKNKKNTHIRNEENAFLVLDDIESGFGNKIPLWLFGFLY